MMMKTCNTGELNENDLFLCSMFILTYYKMIIVNSFFLIDTCTCFFVVLKKNLKNLMENCIYYLFVFLFLK
jgi:hypothetical protein